MTNYGGKDQNEPRRRARFSGAKHAPRKPHNVISIETFPPEVFYDCDADGEQMADSPHTAGAVPGGTTSERDRDGSRVLSVSVPVVIRHHRDTAGPGTLEVGKISAGSLDLALNILTYLYPPQSASEVKDEDTYNLQNPQNVRCRVNLTSATAYTLHQKFCADFLAPLDSTSHTGQTVEEIPVERIRSWVLRQTETREL